MTQIDSTVQVATTAPAASLEASVARFKTESGLCRKAMTASLGSGLKAVAYASTMLVQARLFGTPEKHFMFLIFGKDKLNERDGGEAKVYRAAKGIALRWMNDGLPEGMAQCNSFTAAADCALTWFGLKEVKSVEGVQGLLNGGTPGKASDIVKTVTNAVKKADFDYAAKGKSLGEAIVNTMGLAKSGPFARAVAETYAALVKAEADLAASKAQAELAATPEPEAMQA